MTDHSRARFGWPLLVAVLTAAYATLPYLGSQTFYHRGDTAVQFAPTWFRFGELVREGVWPIWMDPGSWAGGNYVGEALFGTYNPLNVLIWVFVSLGPDLVLSVFIVKVALMVLLALGAYALAREYGAERWASAVVALALPFGGFTLYWDAGSWPVSLMAFMYTPWVWVTFRRALRGAGHPFWAFCAGALAVTHGYPYGTLAVVVVGLAMVVEGTVRRQWRGLGRVVGAGALVAALLPLVYLPLLRASELATRSTQGQLFENTGKLRPGLADLFALSSPLHVPPITAITGAMQVPATYLAWFVLPLLPWLRYRVLGERSREFTGLAVVTVLYLAMALGPSKLWLFRWPLRLVEYVHLGLLVLLAVLLSQGLARDRVRLRLGLTALLLASMAWMSWSQDPAEWRRVLIGTVVVVGGTAALVGVHLALRSASQGRAAAALACVMVLGVGAVLGLQVKIFGENEGSRGWYVPRDVDRVRADHASLEGRVMHFVNLKPLQNEGRVDELRASWRDVLPGSMYHVAGVEAVNNYTGMGFRPFSERLCMEYDGMTWRCGFPALWSSAGVGDLTLADMMKLDTVVVHHRQARGVDVPDGWVPVDRTPRVRVLERTDPHPWPDSELVWAAGEIDVTAAETVDDLHQRVEVAGVSRDADLLFSMLGWPGWRAEVDGTELDVDHDPAGFLRVRVPEGTAGTVEVTYAPPGLGIGLAGAGIAVLGAGLWGLHGLRRRARGTSRASGSRDDPHDAAASSAP